MTADENVAIMRRAYEAFNRGDTDTLIELLDEGAVWHLPGRSSMANDYQGREATLAYFGQIGQKTGGTFQAERGAARLLPSDRSSDLLLHRRSPLASLKGWVGHLLSG